MTGPKNQEPHAPNTQAEPSDAALVDRARRELPYNTTSYERLVRRYEPFVYRTCLSYLRSEQDAEEVSQDVFLKVFHALPKFEGRSAFRTWLYRIVRNECASQHRRRKRIERRREAVEHYLSTEGPALWTPAEAGEDALSGPMGEGLGQLSEQDREMLILRHIAGLAIQEIAETLAIGLSAAKMRLYRAEERLRDAYRTAAGNDSL